MIKGLIGGTSGCCVLKVSWKCIFKRSILKKILYNFEMRSKKKIQNKFYFIYLVDTNILI